MAAMFEECLACGSFEESTGIRFSFLIWGIDPPRPGPQGHPKSMKITRVFHSFSMVSGEDRAVDADNVAGVVVVFYGRTFFVNSIS